MCESDALSPVLGLKHLQAACESVVDIDVKYEHGCFIGQLQSTSSLVFVLQEQARSNEKMQQGVPVRQVSAVQ